MLRLRLAAHADLPALVDLLAELFAQEREFSPDRTAQMRGLVLLMERAPDVRIMVADLDGRVVGMGVVHTGVSTYLGAKVGTLEDVIVTSALRGSGIGRRLLAALIEQARADGLQRITLLTDHNNMAGQAFYEGFGFKRSTMVPYRLMLAQAATA